MIKKSGSLMSVLLFVLFIVGAAYWLISTCRRKRPRVRGAAYFHSSGFTQGRSSFDAIFTGAWPWKR